jgi:hypothetical protein
MKIDARKLSPQEQREKRSTALRMREQGYTYRLLAKRLVFTPALLLTGRRSQNIKAKRLPLPAASVVCARVIAAV